MKSTEKITALYCRLACEDEHDIKAQEESLIKYAEEHGHSDIKIYSDNGHSGLSFDRPAFSDMEKDMQADKVGTVIVKDQSRIGRKLIETINWIDRVTEMGISIVIVDGQPDMTPLENDLNLMIEKMIGQESANAEKKI